jgi:hypothetical protein
VRRAGDGTAGAGPDGARPWHHCSEMSDIERRRSSRPNRQQRVERAYRLTVATGALGIIGVAGLVLAIVGIIGAGLPILALVLAAVCFVLLRRTVS